MQCVVFDTHWSSQSRKCMATEMIGNEMKWNEMTKHCENVIIECGCGRLDEVSSNRCYQWVLLNCDHHEMEWNEMKWCLFCLAGTIQDGMKWTEMKWNEMLGLTHFSDKAGPVSVYPIMLSCLQSPCDVVQVGDVVVVLQLECRHPRNSVRL